MCVQSGEDIVKKIKGVFAFKVKQVDGKEGVWIVDAKNGSGAVKFGIDGSLYGDSLPTLFVL